MLRESHSRLPEQLIVVVVAAYTHVLMEWLFFVTKPSPLAALSRFEQLEVLLVTPLPVAAIGCATVLVLWLLGRVARPAALGALIQIVGWAPSAALFAVCAFILIDNFTYTLFTFGVVSSNGWQRAGYATLVLALFVLIWWRLVRWAHEAHTRQRGWLATFLACCLVFVSAGSATWQYLSTPAAPLDVAASHLSPEELPNIVLFAADGLEVAHMSAFGYARATTPTIEKIAQDALVFENAFHNGGHTTASDASMLTSKYALSTGVLGEGHFLKGIDAYQHLPGILRRLGYRSMFMGLRDFGDPFTLNIRDGFDSANGRQFMGEKRLPAVPRSLAVAYSSEIYFLTQVYWRIADRLLHAAGIEPMVNPYLEVKKRRTTWREDMREDEKRVARILEYIEEAGGPFFVHGHLMGTHPPLWPQRRVFSKDGEKSGDDAYDDTILEFDGFVAKLVDALERNGELDKTLFIITSDHGRHWLQHRLPLLFRFPGRTHRGIVRSNVQLLDVAPTILDYLGVEIPQWMEGESLISSKPHHLRPIFGLTVGRKDRVLYLKAITVQVCHRVFSLDTRSGNVKRARVRDHTSPCAEADSLSVAEMKPLLMEQLRRNGYDEEYIRAGGVPSAEQSSAR